MGTKCARRLEHAGENIRKFSGRLTRNESNTMLYRWSDIPALLRTPVGRSQFMRGLRHHGWPLVSRLAILHRRMLVKNTRVVAVIGSFGKSTTTRATLAALGMQIPRNYSDNSLAAVASAILRCRPRDQRLVLEAGIDRPGQMTKHASVIRPDIVVVTSVGSEHNRSLGTLEETRSEKSEMVRALPSSGIAVLNGDDPNVCFMANQTKARVITFGLADSNDITASDIALDWPHGTRFTLGANGQVRQVQVRLIGRHMVYPILAAVAVALAEGLDLDQVVSALEALPPTPGRMQPVKLANGAYLLRDDFKGQLETIETALETLTDITAPRRLVVLGDVQEPPGKQGPIYRRIGKHIADVASFAIFVGGESVQSYRTGAARKGMARESTVWVRNDLETVADLLWAKLQPGDVVLIKGRSTQRLERLASALMGTTVRCDIKHCRAKPPCQRCAMLTRGWRGRRVMT